MVIRQKIILLLSIFMMSSILFSGCSFLAASPSPAPTVTSSPSPMATSTPSPSPAPTATPTPYHPGGPDIISLYVNRTLVSGEYRTTWVTGKDIGVFYAYPMREAGVAKLPYMDLFKLYWNTDLFPNADEYKIGYFLSFTLRSSEVVEMTIRLPKDCPKDPSAYFYQFIEIYVYDNLHRIPGPSFFHLEESSTYEETIMTSIKLTAGTRSSEVVSAKLTAFIFKDDSDFDPDTGRYIGHTSCTVDVLKDN